MENIVIGIEGLVGAGKTSVCRKMLDVIPNSILFNGGNLYRAIVYAMVKNGNKIEEMKSQGKSLDIKEMMDLFKVEIRIENRETIIYIDGTKVSEDDIQSKEASLNVSKIGGSADNKSLFKFSKDLIESLKKEYNIIVAGRSLMIIYPELDYHFFVTADIEERVRRKLNQYDNKETYEDIKNNIETRDRLQEEAGFYKLFPNTIKVDVTDCKSVEESTLKLMSYIKLED